MRYFRSFDILTDNVAFDSDHHPILLKLSSHLCSQVSTSYPEYQRRFPVRASNLHLKTIPPEFRLELEYICPSIPEEDWEEFRTKIYITLKKLNLLKKTTRNLHRRPLPKEFRKISSKLWVLVPKRSYLTS
jgi:hypothetical protein